MAATLVQDATGTDDAYPTLASDPTPGNLLTLHLSVRDPAGSLTMTGWTEAVAPLDLTPADNSGSLHVWYRFAQAGEPATVALPNLGAANIAYLAEWSGVTGFLDAWSIDDQAHVTAPELGPVTGEPDALAIGAILAGGHGAAGGTSEPIIDPVAPAAELHDSDTSSFGPFLVIAADDDADGTYSMIWDYAGAGSPFVGPWGGILLLFATGGGDPPDPDPDPDVPEVDPQGPARALVEIYVSDPGSFRWGEAQWGEATWGSSGWQDMTPESMTAELAWGADRAERGILARTAADAWTIRTYDPDRKLDPANADSPWAGEIVQGVPIRVTHRGRPIRTGILDTASYSHARRQGELRVTSRQALVARATLPGDESVGTTLRARARAVLAAVSVPLTVEGDPPAGDPLVVAQYWDSDRNAWDVIAEAALSALNVPYLDNEGVLRFRPYAAPVDRGVIIGSDELVDLIVSVSDDGLYSAVSIVDSDDGRIDRAITPTPRYGRRVLALSDDFVIVDAEAWAEAVLLDRGELGALRWVPGRIRPLDADSVETLANIDAVELITVQVPEADPPVTVTLLVLGAKLRISDRGGPPVRTDWEWYLDTATTATITAALLADDDDSYLVADDDPDAPLYPDA